MHADRSPAFLADADADLHVLAGQRVAVVGYGNLGRPLALNLRDSGLQVAVGNRDDEFRDRAERDGFEVGDVREVVAGSDLVWLLVPDEVIPGLFAEQVAPALRPGCALVFASGYALAFGLVAPPPDVDVLLVAPRMVGPAVRETFLAGSGVASYLSVERDAGGKARERMLALARAGGLLRRTAMELSARQEALLDLFIEQSVGPCLGLALQLAFQLGTEAGIPAEALVLELYMSGEMAQTLRSFADHGFYESVVDHGEVATYGGFLGMQALDHAALERRFRQVLDDIGSGAFARRLQEEAAAGYPTSTVIRAMTALENPLTEAERRVRAAQRAADGAGAGPVSG